MLPFLVGQLTVTKPDGTVVKIGGKSSSEDSDDEHQGDGSSTHASTPSKHHRSDSGGLDGTIVPVVAIVFVFVWLIVKALMAPFTQKAGRRARGMAGSAVGLSDEEQAVLLKLQRTIVDMEGRIESLETILIDEHRTKEKYGSKI